MVTLRTPADRENIPRIITTPIIKCSPPSIELHVYLIPVDRTHRCWTDEVRVLSVHCLKLLTLAEFVERWSRWFLFVNVCLDNDLEG